ncbi:MAG: T9SS type A sorting domain-containing protein [Bacteroidia bacterium]
MKIKLPLLLSALLMALTCTADFSGLFDYSQWTFSSTTVNGDGSVNTSGAPYSIILNGSDNNQGGTDQYEDWQINCRFSGTLSFNYSHVNNDIDYAFYVINGYQTLITKSGSGKVSNIAIQRGDNFSFRVVNSTNCCGRGVLTISDFNFVAEVIQPGDRTACVNQGMFFKFFTPDLDNYRWEVNTGSGYIPVIDGGVYSGANTPQLTLSNIPASFNGYLYRCIGSSFSGAYLISNVAKLTVSSMVSTISAQTNVTCHGDSTGSATVSMDGGDATLYQYSWQPYGGWWATASRLAAGTYTCSINLYYSCFATQTVIITEPAAILTTISSQTNVACNGGATGAATIKTSGGTGAFTYSWAPSGGTASTATGLTAGTYTVTIKDANSCIKTKQVAITQPVPLSASYIHTNVGCHGDSSGMAKILVIGGTPPNTYLWNTPHLETNSTLNHLPAGSYTCTITDANNCIQKEVIVITEPAMLTATTTHIDVSCFGDKNGSAIITTKGGTGSYTYAWAPSGGTGATAIGLATGNYTVTVTDSIGCELTKTIAIAEPTKLLATAASTPIPCFGKTSTVNIDATGGTPPYTGTGIFIRPGGVYTYNVSDANSCMNSIKIDIQEPSEIKTSQSISLCSGKKLVVGDSTYTKSGIYVNVFKTTPLVCDSTVTTYLTVTTVEIAVTVKMDTLIAAANNGTYQWIDCATGLPISGATAQTYRAVKSGSYAIIVVDANCKDTSLCTSIVLLGIAKQTVSDQLKVYPNPSRGTFTIYTTLPGRYSIVNELGQTVQSFQLNSTNSYSTIISELSNGTYYVIGLDNSSLLRQKIVVIK